MRQKLEGNSGALHEIDVLAKRQNKVLAVECKNYNESRLVGIKEIRDFQSKMQDLPYITDSMFVTNTRFSSEADTYAKHNQITLYDGEKLKNEFYLMSIGRLDSSSTDAIPQQDVVLDFTLPLVMNYREATRLDLVNPYSAKISHATLVLRPFYVFNYIADVKRRLLIGRGFHEEGIHIVDAMTGEILDTIEQIETKVQSYPFFSKSSIRPKDSEEILGDIEKNKIIVDLQNIKPQPKYKIHQTGEYAVIKLEAKVPIDAARRMVKEEVIEETKVNYDDVQIIDKAFSSIYVPKWVINIESHNRIYAREILAASSTILMDEIAYCPKEFFARFRSGKKQTYAVCERCGTAYCRSHIDQTKDSYYCKDHR